MLIETRAQLIAVKRHAEMLAELVRVADLAVALGCGLGISAKGQGLARRVVLDVRMDAPGHELPDALKTVDELFAEKAQAEPRAQVPAFLRRVPAPAPEAKAAPEPAPETKPAPEARPTAKPLAKKTKAGEPWTDDEDQRAIDLKVAGLSTAEIAARLNRPAPGTEFRLKTKLAPRIAEERARRVADAEAARRDDPAPVATKAKPAHVAPAPAAKPAPAPQPDDGLPYWQRALRANLNALGHVAPFTAQTDLDLMECLARGDGLAGAVDRTGIAKEALRARFAALKSAVGLHAADTLMIEDQTRLLVELRARVAAPVAG